MILLSTSLLFLLLLTFLAYALFGASLGRRHLPQTLRSLLTFHAFTLSPHVCRSLRDWWKKDTFIFWRAHPIVSSRRSIIDLVIGFYGNILPDRSGCSTLSVSMTGYPLNRFPNGVPVEIYIFLVWTLISSKQWLARFAPHEEKAPKQKENYRQSHPHIPEVLFPDMMTAAALSSTPTASSPAFCAVGTRMAVLRRPLLLLFTNVTAITTHPYRLCPLKWRHCPYPLADISILVQVSLFVIYRFPYPTSWVCSQRFSCGSVWAIWPNKRHSLCGHSLMLHITSYKMLFACGTLQFPLVSFELSAFPLWRYPTVLQC